MDDPDSLDGMARSIDALFSDAERRHGRAGPDAPASAPAAGADAEERLAAARTQRALDTARPAVEASVASADLLDDVEVLPPRTQGRTGPVSIDAEGDEDAERLAAAAAWGASPVAPAPGSPAEGVEGGEEADEESPSTLDEAPPSDAARTAPSAGDALASEPEVSGPAPPAEAPAPDEVALRARRTASAVEAFLAAEPRRREAAADAVREAAAAHREARELDAPADAVERLALAGEGRAVELARELAVSAVASRVVARLGMARDDERREELFRVAAALGEALAPALADGASGAEDRSARRNYVEALVRLGDVGVREAEAMVADPRWFVVRNGVAILGEAGGSRAVEHLISTLGHEHPRVRRETLMALAHLGGEDAGILASGKLEDPEPEVRSAAAMAVGALRVERAQRTLQALLEREEDDDVLVEVLRALGRLGDPGAVPAIEKKAAGTLFSRPRSEVRAAAYRALAAIGTPHARRLIEDAADDRDPEVRGVARALLQER